jgi:inhibitor of lysozyme (Ivy)
MSGSDRFCRACGKLAEGSPTHHDPDPSEAPLTSTEPKRTVRPAWKLGVAVAGLIVYIFLRFAVAQPGLRTEDAVPLIAFIGLALSAAHKRFNWFPNAFGEMMSQYWMLPTLGIIVLLTEPYVTGQQYATQRNPEVTLRLGLPSNAPTAPQAVASTSPTVDATVDPDAIRASAESLVRDVRPTTTAPRFRGYPYEIYHRDRDFASAIDDVVADIESSTPGETWFERLAGVNTPIQAIADRNGKTYIVFSTCKPHECPDGRFYGYYDPDTKHAAAVFFTASKGDTISATIDMLPMLDLLRVMPTDGRLPNSPGQRQRMRDELSTLTH